jgi:hypothetical protein
MLGFMLNMIRRQRLGLGLATLAANGILSAGAATLTLKPVADTSLFEQSPDNNLGRSQLAAGTIRLLKKSRALVRFDVSAVPANVVISSATLAFKVVKSPSGAAASTFEVRRVLTGWSEGTKSGSQGAPAAAGEATWRSRGAGSWAAPGGAIGTDFAPAASATRALSGSSLNFASTAGLVGEVQSWVTNPAGNFGWVLMSQSEATAKTARRLGNRETAGSEPTLTIDYTIPVEPKPARLENPQRVGDKFEFKFVAEPNQRYTVEYQLDLGHGTWQTLQVLPAVPVSQTHTVEDPIVDAHRSYRVTSP